VYIIVIIIIINHQLSGSNPVHSCRFLFVTVFIIDGYCCCYYSNRGRCL